MEHEIGSDCEPQDQPLRQILPVSRPDCPRVTQIHKTPVKDKVFNVWTHRLHFPFKSLTTVNNGLAFIIDVWK